MESTRDPESQIVGTDVILGLLVRQFGRHRDAALANPIDLGRHIVGSLSVCLELRDQAQVGNIRYLLLESELLGWIGSAGVVLGGVAGIHDVRDVPRGKSPHTCDLSLPYLKVHHLRDTTGKIGSSI